MIPWHQDGAAWGHPRVISVMAFLDRVGPDSGCISIVPGMHRAGLYAAATGKASMDLRDPRQAAMTRQALSVCLEPGDALILHSCTPHCSNANQTEHSRRYLTFAYVDEADKAVGHEKLPAMEAIALG